MFIAVVIVFAICWLPYHLYFIFTYHFNELTKSPMVQHVYLGFYWLAMSNSMFNPFVYYWMNSRYYMIYDWFLAPSMIIMFCTNMEISKIDLTSHFCFFLQISKLHQGIVPIYQNGLLQSKTFIEKKLLKIVPRHRCNTVWPQSDEGRNESKGGAIYLQQPYNQGSCICSFK